MAITPTRIPPVHSSVPLVTEARSLGPGANRSVDTQFTEVMEALLERANEPHLQADQALRDLVAGKTGDVHDVVLSMVKADMSFRLVLELRNRLTEAYQEIMRMQV
jgi:flagellar hook-basal body complex protein FliE